MTSANRVALSSVMESTLGTTPVTPRMRGVRFTDESLDFSPDFLDSDEIRFDGMLSAPVKIMQASKGGINGEVSYPVENSPFANIIQSAMRNPWVNTPTRDNDGVADSVITGVATTNEVLTVTTGAAFVVGQLAKFSGFGVANNNGVFKCTLGSATVPRFIGAGLTDEAAPPAAARVKVVGFQGAAADITATANGLASTLLDFTTLGLAVGMWVKIGGSAVGTQFATAANNNYARISAIAAAALTLDNLPIGWGVDAGTGKTISVWIGDVIKNGVTVYGQTFEKGFMAQPVPTYIVYTGECCNTLEFSLASRQQVKWAATFMGMGGSKSTATLDAAPDANTTPAVMAGNANVGRLAENGALLAAPNWAREFTLNINNNMRQIEAVDYTSPQDIQLGENSISGRLNAYFGSDALLTKFYAGTPSSLNSRIFKNNQAIIFDVPVATYRGGGNPQVTGKNTDVMIPLEYTASLDVLTNAQVLINRMEYVESAVN